MTVVAVGMVVGIITQLPLIECLFCVRSFSKYFVCIDLLLQAKLLK